MSAWWRRGRARQIGRLSWLQPNSPKARRARTIGTAAAPPGVGAIDVSANPPEPVRWLLQSPDSLIPTASSVDVVPRYDAEVARPVTPLATLTAPVGPPTGVARPTEGPVTAPTMTQPSLVDRLRAILGLPLDALLPGADSVLEWAAELKPYQLDGVRTLLERDRLLLADDMGLGKTVQAAAAIRIMCIQRTIERALLIVPAGLVDQWRRELNRWAPELSAIIIRGTAQERAWKWKADAHVTLVSYETFRSDFTPNTASPPRSRLWDLVVLDEAQKIKNRDVDISRSVKQISRRRSWAMTGTPLENKLDDLASIMEFVDYDEGQEPRRYVPSPQLLERHRELQLRRRKADVLDDLPPKQVITVQLPLLARQQQSYNRAESEGVVQLRERGSEVRIQHVLELITRLKQICNVDAAAGESAKFEDIRERLTTLSEEGHRALLFSQYTDETFGVAAAAKALSEFKPLTYTGAMSGGQRDATIARFKSDDSHRALILSLKAGGVGLNLQDASYVFHIDRWWNPAVERQAEDRSHRMGQVFPVTVFKYVCIETIEDRIDKLLAGKQQLFDEIIDDVSILPSRLTGDELFGLFGLDAPQGKTQDRADRRSGIALEERCAAILEARGWAVRRTPVSRDGGIDLVATKADEVGIEQTMFVQCKDHATAVGVEVVRELLGVIPPDRLVRAVIAAPVGVTRDGRALAELRSVVIWDEQALSKLEADVA